MSRKTSILKMNFMGFLVIIFLMTGSLGGLMIYEQYRRFAEDLNALETETLRLTKQILRQKAETVIELINSDKRLAEKNVRGDLRQRVLQACTMVNEIYKRHLGRMSDEAIKQKIIQHLKKIRFDNGRGYYFGTTGDNGKELIADIPELTGRQLINVSDASAETKVRQQVAMVTGREEAFYRYQAPGFPVTGSDAEVSKLTFVKYFEPFGWYIGTGTYLNELQRNIQKRILERMFDMEHVTAMSVYIFQYDGTVLYHTRKQHIGRNILWQTDKNGMEVNRVLLDLGRRAGGGDISYTWEKPDTGEPAPKLSYAIAYDHWKWVIVADRYTDDINTMLQRKKKEMRQQVNDDVLKLSFLFVGFVILVVGLSRYFSGKVNKEFNVFIDFFKTAAISHKEIAKKRLYFIEFRELALCANKMIQDRKKTEQALKESEEHVRLLLNSTAEAIFGLDLDGNCTFANPACLKLLGYENDAHKIIDKKIHDLIHHTHPDGSPYPFETCTFCKSFKEGKKVHVEDELLWRFDGTSFPAECWSYPIYWNDRIQGSVVTFLDISKRKIAEESLRKAYDELEDKVMERTADLSVAKEEAIAANRAKSDFVARMSHEIRTPLNAVTGLTQVILKSEMTEEQRNHLNKIKFASNQLLEIINDILDFSKIEAGRLEMHLAPFDLELLMSQLANVFSPQTTGKDLELILHVDPKAPRQLKGDATRLTQILTNLVGNAVKFTEKGEVVLQVVQNNLHTSPHEAALTFTVKDTGIGIDKEVLATMFDPFTQADSSLTRRYQGTGLGLAICRQLVSLMGGRIWAESRPGEGSAFHFTVTLESLRDQPSRSLSLEKLHGLRALVVDDSATARHALAGILESFSFDVTTVDSGEKALKELQRNTKDPYRLVLLDWRMPDIDGLETARRIYPESDSGTNPPGLPIVIMVTAYGFELVKTEIASAPIDTVLHKPVSASELFTTIMTLFNREHAVLPFIPVPPTEDAIQRHAGCRVLVVDDSDLNLDVAKALLTTKGIHVETAANGPLAVEKVTMSKTNTYDTIFMDIQMPEMDGYEATRQIRTWEKRSRNPSVPIIALTAHTLSGEKEKCRSAGLNDFLAKPIDEHELNRILSKWLPHQDSEDSTGQMDLHGVSHQSDGQADVSVPLDPQSALNRLGGQKKLYAKVLEMFKLAHAPNGEDVRFHLSAGDRKAAQNLAHKVKGMASTIGAYGLAEAASILEKAITDRDKKLEILVGHYDTHMILTLDEINAYLDTNGRGLP